MGKEYKVTFDMYNIKKHIGEPWKNVLHFTIGSNHGKYGDRIPWVSILENKIRIDSAVNGKPILSYNHPTAWEQGKWVNIEVSQTLVGEKVMRNNSIKELSI